MLDRQNLHLMLKWVVTVFLTVLFSLYSDLIAVRALEAALGWAPCHSMSRERDPQVELPEDGRFGSDND